MVWISITDNMKNYYRLIILGQKFSGLWVGRFTKTIEELLIYSRDETVGARVYNVRYAIVGDDVSWLEENFFLLRVHECG